MYVTETRTSCEHEPFEACEPCKAEYEAASAQEPEATETEAPEPELVVDESAGPVHRSDGAVLFKQNLDYLVSAGGDFGTGKVFDALKRQLRAQNITVEARVPRSMADWRKYQARFDVCYSIWSPNGVDWHVMAPTKGRSTAAVPLGGLRGNLVASVRWDEDKVVFDPPEDGDNLSDKEDLILDALQTLGGHASPPELAKHFNGKPGFGLTKLKEILPGLAKAGYVEKIGRKYHLTDK